MNNQKVYQAIASALQARKNCLESNNKEWLDHLTNELRELTKDYLPSGSGIDFGCSIEIENEHPEKSFTIYTGFHHIDEYGGYSNWTDHTIRVYPDWTGIKMTISGRDQNGIKNYLYDVFSECLESEIEN